MHKMPLFILGIIVLVLLPLQDSFAAQTTGRMPGAKIVAPSCDPLANPSEDADKTYQKGPYFPDKSCFGQGIDRDSFKILVSFDPKLPSSGDGYDVTTPGDPKFPDDTTLPVYTSNGVPIQACNGGTCTPVPLDDLGFIHTGDGVQVQYTGPIHDASGAVTTVYNEPVHKEGSFMTYPSDNSVVIDRGTGQPMKYEKECDHGHAIHSIGENIRYEAGQPIMQSDCIPVEDCNGVMIAGQPMNFVKQDGSCSPVVYSGNPINSVLGEETTETIELGLFAARFSSEYEWVDQSFLDTAPSKETWMSLGQQSVLIPNTQTRFEMVPEGNKACVYAYIATDTAIQWRVERSIPLNINQVNDVVDTGAVVGSAPITDKHCFRIPAPVVPYKQLSWGQMIAESCTDPNARASKWSFPFVGPVVQCIEETMVRIFLPNEGDTYIDAAGNEVVPSTFFGNMQNKLKSAIRALLALYIIFFGFKLLVARDSKEVPDRSEWMWFGIKFAMVVYFALGVGMVDMLPRFMNVSKGLSMMFLEAGMDSDPNPTVSGLRRESREAQIALNAAMRKLNDQVVAITRIESDTENAKMQAGSIQAALDGIELELNNAIVEMNEAWGIRSQKEQALFVARQNMANAQEAYDSAAALIDTPNPVELVDIAIRERLCELDGPCYGGVLGIEDGGMNPDSILKAVEREVENARYPSRDFTSANRRLISVRQDIALQLEAYNNALAQAEQQVSQASSAGQISEVPYDVRYNLCVSGGACYGNILNISNGDEYPQSQLSIAQSAFDIADTNYNNALSQYQYYAGDQEDGEPVGLLNEMEESLTESLSIINGSEQNLSEANNLLIQYQDDVAQWQNTVVEKSSILTDAINVARENAGDLDEFSWGGYEYCDFRDLDYGDKPTMRLWDTVDCKISKYIGLGDSARYPWGPSIFATATLAIFYTAWGIPIFIFTTIFLAFMMLTTFRIAHIYILAFVGLVLLVYISPLVIPAALFKWSKSIFDFWLRQVIAYIIQPVVMFAFLSFMFIIMDHVVFGGNHNFVATNGSPVANKIWDEGNNSRAATSPEQCKDSKAIACTYQTIKFGTKEVLCGDVLCFFKNFPTVEFGEVYDSESSTILGQDYLVFIGLLKLILICFVINVTIQAVEKISASLVDAMGGGAAVTAKGGVPNLAPSQIASGLSKLGGGAATKIAEPVVKWVGKTALSTPRGVARAPGKVAETGKSAARGIKQGAQKIKNAASSAKQGVKQGASVTKDALSGARRERYNELREAGMDKIDSRYASKNQSSEERVLKKHEGTKIADNLKKIREKKTDENKAGKDKPTKTPRG